MVETITKIISSVGLLALVALLISGGFNLFSDNIYYGTDGENITCKPIECFKLSKVNEAGIQRNCYYNESEPRKYRVCSTGWNKYNPEVYKTIDKNVTINITEGEICKIVKGNNLIKECVNKYNETYLYIIRF